MTDLEAHHAKSKGAKAKNAIENKHSKDKFMQRKEPTLLAIVYKERSYEALIRSDILKQKFDITSK